MKQQLPDSTEVDVVAICGEKKIVKRMTIKDWLSLVRKPGWSYIAYQIGYHAHHDAEIRPPTDSADPKPV